MDETILTDEVVSCGPNYCSIKNSVSNIKNCVALDESNSDRVGRANDDFRSCISDQNIAITAAI